MNWLSHPSRLLFSKSYEHRRDQLNGLPSKRTQPAGIDYRDF